jgi:hypothetical protein
LDTNGLRTVHIIAYASSTYPVPLSTTVHRRLLKIIFIVLDNSFNELGQSTCLQKSPVNGFSLIFIAVFSSFHSLYKKIQYTARHSLPPSCTEGKK